MSQATPSTNQQALLADAILQLRQMRAKLEAIENKQREPIAVIGMACRFPGGANTPEAFWDMLVNGVDAVTEIPTGRWDVEEFYDPDPDTPGKMYTRYGGFVDEVDQFDPTFFGISPREAVGMDPQQRLLLEVAWEALENAGLAAERLKGSQTGVFMGLSYDDYASLNVKSDLTTIDAYSSLGNARSVAIGRLSYVLGLQGPTMQLDTACSSSLLAVHLACQSLRLGECDLALAGGVNLILSPEATISFCKMKALAPDGRCKTFDAAADGYGRGEGCGIIVLKPLSAAVAAGDNILALIRGSAVNHDGPSNGLTAPNALAQEAVIRQALTKARLRPDEVHYVETHGTGTILGDPIEVQALNRVLGTDRQTPLFIGSVKANFGHLESAAGIAGLIKSILSLQHQHIPPQINLNHPNPHIPWQKLPLQVPLQLTPWPDQPRVAGISSFGMSGTNVHLILSEGPAKVEERESAGDLSGIEPPLGQSGHLLTLSAKSEMALLALAERYAAYLAGSSTQNLADICFTANTGRSHFSHRLAVIAETPNDLRQSLQDFAVGQQSTGYSHGQVSGPPRPKIAFLFSGQGSQYMNMGRDLYQTHPIFRQTLDRCAQILDAYLDVPLLEILYPNRPSGSLQSSISNLQSPVSDPSASLRTGLRPLISQTAYTQPALFTLEYALAQLWLSWGVQPDWVMGHSLGEYVAACVAGVFSLEDGLKLVAARGRLMQALPQNDLKVTTTTEENSIIEPVSHAFDSPSVEPLLTEFEQRAREINYAPPQIKFVSNVTGQIIGEEICQPEYWVKHLRHQIRFAQGMETLHQSGVNIFIEVGPKPTLLGLSPQGLAHIDTQPQVNHKADGDLRTLCWLPSLDEGKHDWQQILASLGELYVRGVEVDWHSFENNATPPSRRQRKVILPNYPFQRRRYWIEKVADKREQGSLRPLIDKMTKSPLLKEIVLEALVSTESWPFLADHYVYDAVVVPGTGHLAMALNGTELAFNTLNYQLTDILFPEMLIVPTDDERTVQLIFKQTEAEDVEAKGDFQIISLTDADGHENPTRHATGRLMPANGIKPAAITLHTLQERCTEAVSVDSLYQALSQRHIVLGPSFRWLNQLWRGDGEALGKLSMPEVIPSLSGYVIHPGLLDTCLHVTGATHRESKNEASQLPFTIAALQLYEPIKGREWWCYARQIDHHKWDIQLLDAAGHILMEIIGFETRPVESEVLPGADPWLKWLYTVEWQHHPLVDASITNTPSDHVMTMAQVDKTVSHPQQQCWLIFADQAGLGAMLATRLEQQGDHPILVYANDPYQQQTVNAFTIQPDDPAGYRQLLAAAPPIHNVVYLWSLDTLARFDPDELEAASRYNCGPVLLLVQALLRELTHTPSLYLVTGNAQAVVATDQVTGLAQASLWGLGRVIALEHPELACVRLDLDLEETLEQQATTVWAELMAEPSADLREDQVAVRRQRRYVARLVRHQPGHRLNVSHRQNGNIHGQATYLITGGLGGLGLTVARWLVEQGAKHVVLVGRNQPQPDIQPQLDELKQMGAVVTTAQLDITDKEQVKSLLTQLQAADQEQSRPLRGIIHAAGVWDDGALLQQTWERFATVLGPKVWGAWNLHALTKALPLDFFILFSSAAGLMGNPGQANYASANAFLDTLAHYRRALGLPALSIDWGAWSEVGAATEIVRQKSTQSKAQGHGTISSEQGLAVLGQILLDQTPQVGVLPIDWRKAKHSHWSKWSFLAELVQPLKSTNKAVDEATVAFRQQLAAASPEDQLSLLMEHLQTVAGSVLGLPAETKISPRQGLMELGLDSLMAIELKNRLERNLAQPLSATLLFDYPTLEALTQHLAEQVWPPSSHRKVETNLERDSKHRYQNNVAPFDEPIAIIGMGCRFPGASETPTQFWQLLRDGIDAIIEVPPERWDIEAYFSSDPDAPGKMNTRYGGFLNQVDHFDAQFFGLSPRETVSLDPQQRLLLEVSWEALEVAGMAPSRLFNTSTGVFVGISSNDYQYLLNQSQTAADGLYLATGNALSVAAGRLAYTLGLTGPCLAVDTSCSSSLVAVHQACTSLRRGECDLALTGGVNLILRPESTISFSKARMLAPDGRCKTFDAAANGYVRGEGCGMVVLKRLTEAQTDGDTILAVIRGSMINQDGRSSGLTAPNGPSQEAVIRQALKQAQVNPAEISYVEAHGTGTSLGDPIEIKALSAVFGQRENPLWVGSVKTNIGHLEAAAGVASLIKVVLALHHNQIPPHLHFHQPSPHINWEGLPIQIPTQLTPWPAGRRIAGISSFGFSGTNTHLVLEEAPSEASGPITGSRLSEANRSNFPDSKDGNRNYNERPYHLLTLSAKSKQALQTLGRRYYDYIQSNPETKLSDVCYTANTGRDHFAHRLSVEAGSMAELGEKLAGYLEQTGQSSVSTGYAPEHSAMPQIAFLFTGQGAQYVDMGRELYETQPTFRQVIDRCDRLLRPYLNQSLLLILYPKAQVSAEADTASYAKSKINEAIYAQSALFALEYALATLWQSWGVKPTWVMGHSGGEYVAACVAGVFSLEDALKLITMQGRLMQTLPQNGTMVAVEANQNRVAEFEQIASEIKYTPPKIKLISNVTGREVGDEVCRPEYWAKHMRETVHFAAGMETLHQAGVNIFIELGPNPTLLDLGQECLTKLSPPNQFDDKDDSTHKHPLWLPSLRQGQSDWQQILASLGTLYVNGLEIDWLGFDDDAVVNGKNRHKVILPCYPFERQRYWVAPAKQSHAHTSLRPLIDTMTKSPVLQNIIFETLFNSETWPFLVDHQVYGTVVLPGACQLAMILNGVDLAFAGQAYRLEDILFPEMLVVPSGENCPVQLILTSAEDPTSNQPMQLQLISLADATGNEKLATHTTGSVMFKSGQRPAPVSLDALRDRFSETILVESLYQALAEHQIALGPSFRWLQQTWRGQGETLGRLRTPEGIENLSGYVLHPGLLDACFQVAGLTYYETELAEPQLPFAIAALHVYQSPNGTEWWCHAHQSDQYKWDLHLFDATGQLLVQIVGFESRSAKPDALLSTKPWSNWLYDVQWQMRPLFGLLPDYLPRLTDIHPSLTDKTNALLAEADLSRYQEVQAHLDTISLDYLLVALTKSGFTFQPNTRWSTQQLAQQLGVIPRYHRLLHRLLEMLAEADILHQTGETWQVARVPQVGSGQHTAQPLRECYGDMAQAELILLERCATKLSEVWRGVQDPLELLFPNGDIETATQIYQASPGARVMNQVVQQAVLTAIEHLPTERGLRILEVGAGTGGTTAWLLPSLPATQTEYVFTDIGSSFLTQAQEKFADFDFILYQVLDIEQSPIEQGFEPHQYDLIIAANVLHATQDLKESLAHIQQLLAPGGLLILWEGTTRSRWIDLTFGLTEGWWRFADERRDYPLLTTSQWQNLLLACGFQSAIAVPDEPGLAQPLGQTVIIAQAGETSTPQKRVWLLLADSGGVGEALATTVHQAGDSPILVYAGEHYQQQDEFTFSIRADMIDDYGLLLAAVPPIEQIVHLWSLDNMVTTSASIELEAACRRGCGTVLTLVQALAQSPTLQPPKLGLITRDVQQITSADRAVGLAQASLWGLGRVIVSEHPEWRCVCLDLDGSEAIAIQANMLWAELKTASTFSPREDQVSLRQGRRYVARLARYSISELLNVPDEPFQLTITQRGSIDNLTLQPRHRRQPGPGEVEIRVKATGLNFIDVLDVLGAAPYDRNNELGGECAGEIIAVGPGVDSLRPGDRVIALAPNCFSQYITISADWAFPLPNTLTFAEGATLFVNFLTAYYALSQLAHISAGDKVLIHAATGGTGLAAVQIALQAGAKIFATTSPGKQEALKSLGIEYIYNSRTLDFADHVLRDTDGQGVDIVLNALTGAGFVAKSLATLASGGVFLEIAGREVWSVDEVRHSRPDVRYHLINMRQVMQQHPAEVRAILEDILQQVEKGCLKPLPQTSFPIEKAIDAFRYIQQAKHIGKVIITPTITQTKAIQSEATYLITGGLGGLGLAVARWLVEQGAGHVALLGRNQPGPDTQNTLTELEKLGAKITIAQADVSNIEQLRTVLERIETTYPLRGVIHAAGVLDDGGLQQLSWERFAKVLAPKVWGAWNLHQLTQTQSLDFFVLFASGAGLMGNPGQANHAAANTFLDTLAHYRQSLGLPALSIDWGVWSEVGVKAKLAQREKDWLQSQGQGSIPLKRGLAVLDYLLSQEVPQVGVLPIDWRKVGRDQQLERSFLADLVEPTGTVKPSFDEPALDFRKQLKNTPLDDRYPLLMRHLQTATAKVLGMSAEIEIDPRQGLMEMGLDSLMAIELRNYLARSLGYQLSATLLFNYPTLESLADYLTQEILAPVFSTQEEPAPTSPASPVSEPLDRQATSTLESQTPSEIEKFSQDELLAFISEKFKQHISS
ncbi:MAG: SDR family NAD(P)-dependent oxidoreductase [Anaerolineae bacterium]|nr:SDR family NAD(P)-dependent oxidoreductase [Anaerolineae bacterium]